MLKEKEIMIGDTTYNIRQLPATEGMQLLIYCTKMGGGIFKGLEGSKEEGKGILDKDIGVMVDGLLSKFDEDTTVSKIKKVVLRSVIAPKSFDFDIDLAGSYEVLAELLLEIFKLNYEKSFEMMKKKVGHLISLPDNLKEAIAK